MHVTYVAHVEHLPGPHKPDEYKKPHTATEPQLLHYYVQVGFEGFDAHEN